MPHNATSTATISGTRAVALLRLNHQICRAPSGRCRAPPDEVGRPCEPRLPSPNSSSSCSTGHFRSPSSISRYRSLTPYCTGIDRHRHGLRHRRRSETARPSPIGSSLPAALEPGDLMAGSHHLVPNLAVEAPLVSGQTCANRRTGTLWRWSGLELPRTRNTWAWVGSNNISTFRFCFSPSGRARISSINHHQRPALAGWLAGLFLSNSPLPSLILPGTSWSGSLGLTPVPLLAHDPFSISESSTNFELAAPRALDPAIVSLLYLDGDIMAVGSI